MENDEAKIALESMKDYLNKIENLDNAVWKPEVRTNRTVIWSYLLNGMEVELIYVYRTEMVTITKTPFKNNSL